MVDSKPKTVLTEEEITVGMSLNGTKQSPVFSVWLILSLLAFWSVWRWYFLRVSTSSDEFYGILSLFAVIGICYFNRSIKFNSISLYLTTGLVIFYALTYNYFPPLLRAIIAVTGLTFLISGWRFGKIFHFGIWSLFLLSLPIVASLQFYFGFPLRVIVGEATVFLLKLNGLSVYREGISLFFDQQTILIDAPCSGVKMLWAGFFFTALLTTIYRFNLLKTLTAFSIALGLILIGNIFRATSLFYLEAGLIEMPDFAHEGIGAVCFLFTCIGIVLALQKLKSSTNSVEIEEPNSSQNLTKLSSVFAIACLAGIIIPFFGQHPTRIIEKNTVQFPQTVNGKKLQELGLTEREKYFLEDFPGEVKRFTDGEREIIIRYIKEATRKLHPSADCFSGIGYQIKPLPLRIDNENNHWSCFYAMKDGDKLKICERIFTENGENWTDVSSWYWSALTNENPNGYWAITVAENEIN